MKALRSTLQTVGVLLGIWLVLALVALFAGALPIPALGGEAGGGDADGGATESEDGGVASADDGGAGAEERSDDAGEARADAGGGAIDGGPADAGASVGEAALPRIRRDRWVVCGEPPIAPSLAALDVIGDDGRAEIVVGCGDRWEVLAIREGVPARVVRVSAPQGGDGADPGTGAAGAIDFDGDGRRDLVLPLARYGAGGATRGGGLYVVPRDRFGGFEPPRALAPIAAVAVAWGAIDGDATADLAVVHQANPFARLPSEVWAFSGGASPARRAVLRAGVGAQSVGLADLDRDGHLDVIVTSAEDARADVFFGSGTGSFPRRHTLAIPRATAIAIGDVDGDGAADAVIEAGGVVVVRARAASEGALEVERIDAAPASVRGVAVAQLDPDPALEIAVWDAPRLVVLDRDGAGGWESRARIELGHAAAGGGDLGARRFALADVDADGLLETVLLGVSAVDGPRALELVVVPGSERGVVDVGDRHDVPDAPLVLTIPLPDAQAP